MKKNRTAVVLSFILCIVLVFILASCDSSAKNTKNGLKYMGFKYADISAVSAKKAAPAAMQLSNAQGDEDEGNKPKDKNKKDKADGKTDTSQEDLVDTYGEYGEILALKQDTILILIYESAERDTILDILINDSVNGINQVYTISSELNPIIRIDIIYNEARNVYIHEVYLLIKGVDTPGERIIVVVETTFLRDMIQGKTSFDPNAKKTIRYCITGRINFVSSINANYEHLLDLRVGTDISGYENPAVRSGYIFGGWFTDNNTFAQPYIFTVMPSGITTLYAKWDIDESSDTDSFVAMRNPIDEYYSIQKEYSEFQLQWNPTLKELAVHLGIDFETFENAEVFAVLDGIVESVVQDTFNGTVITIAHSDNICSIYKSLKDNYVIAGQNVLRGDVIGGAGATMIVEKSQGIHLHFEITVNGNLVDPALYLFDLPKK